MVLGRAFSHCLLPPRADSVMATNARSVSDIQRPRASVVTSWASRIVEGKSLPVVGALAPEGAHDDELVGISFACAGVFVQHNATAPGGLASHVLAGPSRDVQVHGHVAPLAAGTPGRQPQRGPCSGDIVSDGEVNIVEPAESVGNVPEAIGP